MIYEAWHTKGSRVRQQQSIVSRSPSPLLSGLPNRLLDEVVYALSSCKTTLACESIHTGADCTSKL